MNVNAMYIYDSAIDDSDFHNGSSIVEKTSDKYTDGTLSLYTDIGENEYSAKYSFSRRSGEFSTFSLTPDNTSFYKFTNEASMSAYVFVSYEKKTLWWSETISVEQEEDGTYLLNGGTEYTIETYGVQSGGYNFTVEQDNWVYAPDGGMWEVAEYSNSSLFSNNLCYGKIYMPSHRIVSAILELIGDATCVKIDPSVDINDQLKSVLRNTGMQVTEEDFNNAVVTILGVAATTASLIIAILVPEPASTAAGTIKAAKFIIGSIANVCTYWGAPSAFTTLNAYLSKCGSVRLLKKTQTSQCQSMLALG